MISDDIKTIVDKFQEQGKKNFLSETTEEKISSRMVENYSYLQESNYMA